MKRKHNNKNRKQFCKRGHNTLVCGRDKQGTCRECRRYYGRKNYTHVTVDKREKQFCLNGHELSVVGQDSNRACKQCKKDNHPLAIGHPKVQFCPKGHDTFVTGRDKANSQCVVCRREVSRSEKKKIYMKGYYQKHKKELKIKAKPRIKAWRLLKYYNITIEDYNRLLKKQKNRCAGCNRLASKFKNFLSIDHDHKCCSGSTSCGKCIRGLLCQPCNLILGNANDNIKTLKHLIQYLKKYEQNNRD